MHSLFLEHQIDTIHMNQIPVETAPTTHMHTSENLSAPFLVPQNI